MAKEIKEKYELTIGVLFGDLLTATGDKANLCTLKKRMTDRNMDVKIVNISYHSDTIDEEIANTDALYIGDGSDDAKYNALQKLKEHKDALQEYIKQYKPVFSFSGSFSLFGIQLPLNDSITPGLGILHIDTSIADKKFVGYIREQITFGNKSMDIIGFENHKMRINIYKIPPFGKVVNGRGNNASKEDGVFFNNFFGTCLTGAILPQNVLLADLFLEIALSHKYKKQISLSLLSNTYETKVFKELEKKFENKKGNKK